MRKEEIPNGPKSMVVYLEGTHTEPHIVYEDDRVVVGVHHYEDDYHQWGGCVFAAWNDETGMPQREDLYRTDDHTEGIKHPVRVEKSGHNELVIKFEVYRAVWQKVEEAWDYPVKLQVQMTVDLEVLLMGA